MRRPYRPGLVTQVLWWYCLVLSVPFTGAGIFMLVAGIAGGSAGLALYGAFFASFAAFMGVYAWRLIRVGVWVSDRGVVVRSDWRPARFISWSAIEGFREEPGKSVLPFVKPAMQVAIVLRDGGLLLAPALWRGSPHTWGGSGPSAIVAALESSRPIWPSDPPA